MKLRQMNRGSVRIAALLGLLLASAAARAADHDATEDDVAVTPYRPSVSSPAALPAPGWLDVEFGWQRAKGGEDKRRDSFPVAAKLAFNPDWGVVVGSELAARRTDLDGNVFNGVGDTTVLLKHRIAGATEATAWGIAAGYKLPTAKDTLGSGKRDQILSGIFSAEIAEVYNLDVNLTTTRLGVWGDGEGRSQQAWAAALSRSLDDRWGVFVEPSGSSRRGTASMTQLLVGTSYAYSKRTVFDIAVARRTSAAGPDWQLMAGVSMLLGRLW